MSTSTPLRLALLAALLAPACGTEPALRDGVQQVDFEPVRPGPGPAERAALELLEETLFPLGQDSGWSFSSGGTSALADGGTRVVPTKRMQRQVAALRCTRTGQAWTDFHALELRARCAEPVTMRLYFKVRAEGGRVIPKSLQLELAPSAETMDRRLELGPASGWEGAVHALELEFEFASEAPLELHALRFARRAWEAGSEPLGEDEADTRSAREIGLVARGQDCRRAYAADFGDALEAVVDVPREGVLALAVCAADALETDCGPISIDLAIAAHAAPAEFSAYGSLVLDPTTLRERWRLVHFPLADRAGERLRLRITTRLASGAELPPGTARSRILYGAPVVVGARPRDARPNVVLVTLDTTRADVAPRAGWTPHLDRLAERGLVFRGAYSTCNSTTASHASMLTGELLSQHGALDNLHLLRGRARTLAETFRERGWHTAAAVSAEHLNAGTGFGQGFDEYSNSDELRHDGCSTSRRLIGYFSEWDAAPARPFFAWLHLFDAHTPYGPPPRELANCAAEFGVRLPPRVLPDATAPVYADHPEINRWTEGANNHAYLETLYRLGVAWADRALGLLLDDLAQRGWLENTLVVVTSDHGEALGEHAFWYEHSSLHGEVVHVPLVLAGPGVPAATTVDAPASGLDIHPTLLRYAGVEPPAGRLGLDLFDLAAGRTDPARALYFQLERAQQSGLRTPDLHFIDTHTGPIVLMTGARIDEQGRRSPNLLTIEAGTAYLYDNASDPEQLHNLASERAEEVRAARERLAPVAGPDGSTGPRIRAISPAQLERLRQLGYLGK